MGLAKKTVTNRWWELKKKLFSAVTVSADDGDGAAALPKTPAKRKSKELGDVIGARLVGQKLAYCTMLG